MFWFVATKIILVAAPTSDTTDCMICSLLQVELADRLLPCFNSKSKVPYSDVNLLSGNAHAPRWGPDSSTSEVTTIQMEFRDLSKITGEKRYAVSVERRCSRLSAWCVCVVSVGLCVCMLCVCRCVCVCGGGVVNALCK